MILDTVTRETSLVGDSNEGGWLNKVLLLESKKVGFDTTLGNFTEDENISMGFEIVFDC